MSDPVALKCPNCASPLAAESWNQEEGIAKCGYCRTMITLPGAMRREKFRPRPQMPMPSGVSVEATGGGIVITRRWFGFASIFLVLFAIVWDSFLIFWYGMAFSSGAPLMFKVFPLVHVAVGAVVSYLAIAMLFNRTWIKADNGVVSIIHGPLPWRGNMVMPCAEIDQLFCKEKITHGKNGPHVSYEVWAAGRDGGARKLLSIGLSEEQAVFFEQQLEKALGIDDRAVPGELGR